MKKKDGRKQADVSPENPAGASDAGAESEASVACVDETFADDAEAKSSAESEEARLRDRLLRLQADFDNYRKRIARDHVDMVKRANEDLVESLLPVLDHFAHAEASVEKEARADIAPYLEGFRLVRNELARVLESFGVQPIAALGLPFDANLHDALSLMPSEEAEPGTVLFETRKGYTLNGRVLRPSQVIVAAEPEEGASAESDLLDAAGTEA
ncbi:MAG: nucleotide exchange factor GrpE [Kiritimatiellia bacterium]|jgi:molecular chaperone GrpE